jgi:esterase/lipase superfamily enzyme
MADTTLRFVTNRPRLAPGSGGFGPPPLAAAYDTLSFGTATVAASADPAVAGQLTATPVVRGTDSGAPSPALADFLAGFFADARGVTPLLYVHGYNFSFADALVRIADVAACYAADAPALPFMPLLFSWPGIAQLAVQNYLDDRARAQASGHAIARLLIALEAAWKAAGKPLMHVLAHSMGNWALDNGLRALVGSGHVLDPGLFAQALVMAADDDVDALTPGGGLRPLATIARAVTIGVNQQDAVVRLDSDVVLHRPRLASEGPSNPATLPPNVRIVDYTMAVAFPEAPIPPDDAEWNYIDHNYYRTVPRVRADLAQVLRNVAPDSVTGRVTSDALLQQGQPGVKPNRLYVLPFPSTLQTLLGLAGGGLGGSNLGGSNLGGSSLGGSSLGGSG